VGRLGVGGSGAERPTEPESGLWRRGATRPFSRGLGSKSAGLPFPTYAPRSRYADYAPRARDAELIEKAFARAAGDRSDTVPAHDVASAH